MRNYPSYARDIVVRGDAQRFTSGSGLAQKGIQPEIVRQLESYEHARKRRLASEDKRQPVGGVRRPVGHLPKKIPKTRGEHRTSSAGPMDGATRQAVAIR